MVCVGGAWWKVNQCVVVAEEEEEDDNAFLASGVGKSGNWRLVMTENVKIGGLRGVRGRVLVYDLGGGEKETIGVVVAYRGNVGGCCRCYSVNVSG